MITREEKRYFRERIVRGSLDDQICFGLTINKIRGLETEGEIYSAIAEVLVFGLNYQENYQGY